MSPRHQCPTCSAYLRLRNDGRFPVHYYWSPAYPGAHHNKRGRCPRSAEVPGDPLPTTAEGGR